MKYLRAFAAAALAVGVSAGAALAQDKAAAAADEIIVAQKKQTQAPRSVGTHVYLLRGFMDIFSTGMDDLGAKLNRRGIRASVHGHGEYQSLAEGIASRYRAGQRENVVIIGHSLGANAAFQMAEQLGEGRIPVPLIITYDPTAMMTVSANVARVVNFYASNNGWGVSVARGPGFRGTLSNIDLSRRGEMGHTDIDKSPSLHAQSINYIQSIGGSTHSTATGGKPKTDGKEHDSKKSDDAKAAAKDAEKPEATTTASVPPKAASDAAAAVKPADAKADVTPDPKPTTEKTAASAGSSSTNN
jgi:hypothetical protein